MDKKGGKRLHDSMQKRRDRDLSQSQPNVCELSHSPSSITYLPNGFDIHVIALPLKHLGCETKYRQKSGHPKGTLSSHLLIRS